MLSLSNFYDPASLFQYRKRYGLHAMSVHPILGIIMAQVSIPQAVWIACNGTKYGNPFSIFLFQYRKRYGLHAMPLRVKCAICTLGFNTASGMDCMQFPSERPAEPRERRFNTASGMDCMQCKRRRLFKCGSRFNTASGMDCMQYCCWVVSIRNFKVSIPQAVWIACNKEKIMKEK